MLLLSLAAAIGFQRPATSSLAALEALAQRSKDDNVCDRDGCCDRIGEKGLQECLNLMKVNEDESERVAGTTSKDRCMNAQWSRLCCQSCKVLKDMDNGMSQEDALQKSLLHSSVTCYDTMDTCSALVANTNNFCADIANNQKCCLACSGHVEEAVPDGWTFLDEEQQFDYGTDEFRNLDFPSRPAFTFKGDYAVRLEWGAKPEFVEFLVPEGKDIFAQEADDDLQAALADPKRKEGTKVQVIRAGLSKDSQVYSDLHGVWDGASEESPVTAYFCKRCTNNRYAAAWASCWALLPESDSLAADPSLENRECGCTGVGYTGFGLYYGGQAVKAGQQPIKTKAECEKYKNGEESGGFAGAKLDKQQKSALQSEGLVIRVKSMMACDAKCTTRFTPAEEGAAAQAKGALLQGSDDLASPDFKGFQNDVEMCDHVKCGGCDKCGESKQQLMPESMQLLGEVGGTGAECKIKLDKYASTDHCKDGNVAHGYQCEAKCYNETKTKGPGEVLQNHESDWITRVSCNDGVLKCDNGVYEVECAGLNEGETPFECAKACNVEVHEGTVGDCNVPMLAHGQSCTPKCAWDYQSLPAAMMRCEHGKLLCSGEGEACDGAPFVPAVPWEESKQGEASFQCQRLEKISGVADGLRAQCTNAGGNWHTENEKCYPSCPPSGSDKLTSECYCAETLCEGVSSTNTYCVNAQCMTMPRCDVGDGTTQVTKQCICQLPGVECAVGKYCWPATQNGGVQNTCQAEPPPTPLPTPLPQQAPAPPPAPVQTMAQPADHPLPITRETEAERLCGSDHYRFDDQAKYHDEFEQKDVPCHRVELHCQENAARCGPQEQRTAFFRTKTLCCIDMTDKMWPKLYDSPCSTQDGSYATATFTLEDRHACQEQAASQQHSFFAWNPALTEANCATHSTCTQAQEKDTGWKTYADAAAGIFPAAVAAAAGAAALGAEALAAAAEGSVAGPELVGYKFHGSCACRQAGKAWPLFSDPLEACKPGLTLEQCEVRCDVSTGCDAFDHGLKGCCTYRKPAMDPCSFLLSDSGLCWNKDPDNSLIDLADASAEQSSTIDSHGASKAIDGNDDPRGGPFGKQDGCADTTVSSEPWWKLTLPHVYTITAVTVTAGDTSELEKSGLDVLKIWVSGEGAVVVPPNASNETNGTLLGQWDPANKPEGYPYEEPPAAMNFFDLLIDGEPCAERVPIHMGQTLKIPCGTPEEHLSGQEVTLAVNRTAGEPTSLQLCEARLFGFLGAGIARPLEENEVNTTGDEVSQSSTQGNGEAERAIDGNANPSYMANSCTATYAEKSGAWWKIQLKQKYELASVRVTVRDRYGFNLSGLSVWVDDRACNQSIMIDYAETKDIDCHAIGREVKIKGPPNAQLSICEVQVFGAPWESTCVPPGDDIEGAWAPGGKACRRDCLDKNASFPSLDEAWKRCFHVDDCRFIARERAFDPETNASALRYFLRRSSDPGFAAGTMGDVNNETRLYPYACGGTFEIFASNEVCADKDDSGRDTQLAQDVGSFGSSRSDCEDLCDQHGCFFYAYQKPEDAELGKWSGGGGQAQCKIYRVCSKRQSMIFSDEEKQAPEAVCVPAPGEDAYEAECKQRTSWLKAAVSIGHEAEPLLCQQVRHSGGAGSCMLIDGGWQQLGAKGRGCSADGAMPAPALPTTGDTKNFTMAQCKESCLKQTGCKAVTFSPTQCLQHEQVNETYAELPATEDQRCFVFHDDQVAKEETGWHLFRRTPADLDYAVPDLAAEGYDLFGHCDCETKGESFALGECFSVRDYETCKYECDVRAGCLAFNAASGPGGYDCCLSGEAADTTCHYEDNNACFVKNANALPLNFTFGSCKPEGLFVESQCCPANFSQMMFETDCQRASRELGLPKSLGTEWAGEISGAEGFALPRGCFLTPGIPERDIPPLLYFNKVTLQEKEANQAVPGTDEVLCMSNDLAIAASEKAAADEVEGYVLHGQCKCGADSMKYSQEPEKRLGDGCMASVRKVEECRDACNDQASCRSFDVEAGVGCCLYTHAATDPCGQGLLAAYGLSREAAEDDRLMDNTDEHFEELHGSLHERSGGAKASLLEARAALGRLEAGEVRRTTHAHARTRGEALASLRQHGLLATPVSEVLPTLVTACYNRGAQAGGDAAGNACHVNEADGVLLVMQDGREEKSAVLLHGEYVQVKCTGEDQVPVNEFAFCEKTEFEGAGASYALKTSAEGGQEIKALACYAEEDRGAPYEEDALLDLTRADAPGSGLTNCPEGKAKWHEASKSWLCATAQHGAQCGDMLGTVLSVVQLDPQGQGDDASLDLDCSTKCMDDPHCQFWVRSTTTNRCELKTGFEGCAPMDGGLSSLAPLLKTRGLDCDAGAEYKDLIVCGGHGQASQAAKNAEMAAMTNLKEELGPAWDCSIPVLQWSTFCGYDPSACEGDEVGECVPEKKRGGHKVVTEADMQVGLTLAGGVTQQLRRDPDNAIIALTTTFADQLNLSPSQIVITETNPVVSPNVAHNAALGSSVAQSAQAAMDAGEADALSADHEVVGQAIALQQKRERSARGAPAFDPQSTLVSYHDDHGCGPRGADAYADLQQCPHGSHVQEDHPPTEDDHVFATIGGCKYFGYTIYACNDAPTTGGSLVERSARAAAQGGRKARIDDESLLISFKAAFKGAGVNEAAQVCNGMGGGAIVGGLGRELALRKIVKTGEVPVVGAAKEPPIVGLTPVSSMPGAAGAASSAADKCNGFHGIFSSANGGTCCKAECGMCTGLDDCETLSGGKEGCCTGVIAELNAQCSPSVFAPCMIRQAVAMQKIVITVPAATWQKACCPGTVADHICKGLADKLELKREDVRPRSVSDSIATCSQQCPELPSLAGVPEMVDLGVDCEILIPHGKDPIPILSEAQELGGLTEKIAEVISASGNGTSIPATDLAHCDVSAPAIAEAGDELPTNFPTKLEGGITAGGSPDADEPSELEAPEVTHPQGPPPKALQLKSADTPSITADGIVMQVRESTFNGAPSWSYAGRILYTDWGNHWSMGPLSGMKDAAAWLRSKDPLARDEYPAEVTAWERFDDASEAWVPAKVEVVETDDKAKTSPSFGSLQERKSWGTPGPATALRQATKMPAVAAKRGGPPTHNPTPAPAPPTPAPLENLNRRCVDGTDIPNDEQGATYCLCCGGFEPYQPPESINNPTPAPQDLHAAVVGADGALEHLRRNA